MFKKIGNRRKSPGENSNNRKFFESPLAKVEMLLGDSTLAKLNGSANSYTDLSKVGSELCGKEDEEKKRSVETSNNRSREHWFSPDQPLVQGRARSSRNSDSWYRLEAFLKSHGEEELRKIDPTYGQPL